MIRMIEDVFVKNGLIFSFLLVGVMMIITEYLSKRVFKNKIPGVALAIILGSFWLDSEKKRASQTLLFFQGWPY
jgi:hypothetical protein